MCLLLGAASPAAGEEEVTADQVKASYIMKLQSFVLLGDPPHTYNTVCYYEKPGIPWRESVGQIIARYAAGAPDQHRDTLSVRWFRAIRDFSGCDVFYIPADEEGNIDAILAALGSAPTLTVSGAPQFIFRGGMVGFVLDDSNRVKMVANLRNLKARHIQIDSQLLEIMQQVVGQ